MMINKNCYVQVELSNGAKDPDKQVSYTLIKQLRNKAYKQGTLQGVVKYLGLAYVTPTKVMEQKGNLPRTIIKDVISP